MADYYGKFHCIRLIQKKPDRTVMTSINGFSMPLLWLKVGSMNLWSISSQIVAPFPLFSVWAEYHFVQSCRPTHTCTHTHTTHVSSWCINVLTSPPPVNTENKRATDLKRWRGDLFLWEGSRRCSVDVWVGGKFATCVIEWSRNHVHRKHIMYIN